MLLFQPMLQWIVDNELSVSFQTNPFNEISLGDMKNYRRAPRIILNWMEKYVMYTIPASYLLW